MDEINEERLLPEKSVSLVHDTRYTGLNGGDMRQNEQLVIDFREPVTQVGLIRGFLANCFVFYSLLCIVLTGIYIA